MRNYGEWVARAAGLGRPTSAHFELTYRCNLRCKHCFQERDAAPDELTRADWLRVVDQAREAGILVITLSGGEAMLSPHFWDIAGHIRGAGMAFKLFTNGLALTRVNCARLAALRPAAVDISIFSLDPAVHDAITGARGSLRRAVSGLIRLRRAGIAVKVKCPLLDTSSADFRRVRGLAQRYGCGVVFDPFISPKFNGNQVTTQCRGDDEILYEYFEDESTRKPGLRALNPKAPGDAICGVARRFVTVAPDGRMIPCPRMQLDVGNVRHGHLHRIFLEAPLLQKLRATTFGDLAGCGDCSRSGYCGRCSATALLEDGDLYGPSSRSCHLAEVKERAWGVTPPVGAYVPHKSAGSLLKVLR
ncbi:MAG: radical SAM protein [Deltaproteobacteria bacterium]|nr:radical SAM protein [Deltaproteobacteria bacterium]